MLFSLHSCRSTVLCRTKEVFKTWMEAADECDVDSSPWLAKQLHNAKISWVGVFRNVAVSDEDDFIARYGMLTNSREKLSTMAHFWNGTFSLALYCSNRDRIRNVQKEPDNFLIVILGDFMTSKKIGFCFMALLYHKYSCHSLFT